MYKSDSIAKLAEALSQAQAEIHGAEMNSVNPFLKNKYADLGSIIEAARPALAKHGLSFTQLVGGDSQLLTLDTILIHSSGEHIGQIVSLPVGDDKGRSLAQNAGAIITYLRRYSLAAILGVYAGEDTDGEKTQKAPAAKPAEKEAPANAAPPANHPAHGGVAGKTLPVLYVENGISENIPAAANLINDYLPNDFKNKPDEAIAWGKRYRGWRDAGTDVKPAAENATAGADIPPLLRARL